MEQDSQEVCPPPHPLECFSEGPPRRTLRPAASSPRPRPADPLQTLMDQQSHASESRAQCFPPSRGQTGGARRRGATRVRSEQRTVTAAASREGTAASSAPLGCPACGCLVPGPGGSGRGLARSRTHHSDRGHHGGGGCGCDCWHPPRVAPPGRTQSQVSRRLNKAGVKHNTSRAPGAPSTVCELDDVTTNLANERAGASCGRSPAGGAGPAPSVSELKRRSAHPRAWAWPQGHAS